MIPTLPQSDSAEGRAARVAQLNATREELRYNYTYLGSLAFADKVPKSQRPSWSWNWRMGLTVFEIIRNTARSDERAIAWRDQIGLPAQVLWGSDEVGNESDTSLKVEVLDLILDGHRKGRAGSLDEIKSLYTAIRPPADLDESQDDAFFARMRVAGANPMVIRRIAALPPNFPVSRAQFQFVMGDNDTLLSAGEEHRLYLADYSGLDGLQGGTVPHGQKYLAAPLALFAVPASGADRALRAVAIQCGQTPSAATPVLTPGDGLAWQVAKAFVQMADGNYHQAISHLGQTHLVLEPILMATCRQLAAVHPLSVLLMPHFEGTLAINDAAHRTLMAPNGGVDRVMGGTIGESRAIAEKAVETYVFNQAMVPDALDERGVADADAFPGFPYRDDALLVWGAILKWVEKYLSLYYKTDADVQSDVELQAWIAEILSPEGGRLRDIGEGGRIQTLKYLNRAVAHIIFTAGPQHAAVNFPQYPIMSFTPNMPLALYKPPPAGRALAPAENYLDWLPPMDMLLIQLSLGYLLGNVQYTTLGGYADTDAGSFKKWIVGIFAGFHPADYFADPRIRGPLNEFHADLKAVEEEINVKNRSRRPYGFLLPSKIPQSINV